MPQQVLMRVEKTALATTLLDKLLRLYPYALTDLQRISLLLEKLMAPFCSLQLALEDLLVHTGGRYFTHLDSSVSHKSIGGGFAIKDTRQEMDCLLGGPTFTFP